MSTARRADPTDADGHRDLEFLPVDPAAATTLTADQIGHYNRHGFVSPIDVLGAEEADDLRAYFDDLLAEVLGADDQRNAYSINSYHHVCRRLWDLVTDERMVALATDIVGDEAVCWGTHLFAKYPGDPKEVPFHQDGIYWPFTPSKSVTVWLAIDDVDHGNAAMQFVPGTHAGGALPHDDLGLDGTRVLARQASGIEDLLAAAGYDEPGTDDRYEGGRFTNTLRAGQASLHSDLLLHGSAVNTSDRRRAGLTIRYAAADVRLVDGYDDWRKAAVHVGAGDPSGFWYDRRRPDGEHPEKMAAFWGDFDGTPIDAG